MKVSKILFWFLVIMTGVGLMVFASVFRGPKTVKSSNTPTPSLSQTTEPVFSPSGSISSQKPATCQLEGSINFISDNLYETKGAKIKYQNIDSPARLVYWKTVPDDDPFRIGPNIFSGLQLPTGEREVGVSLAKTPVAKSYILTASVTYGVTDSRGVETIKTAPCSGLVKVTLP